MLTAIIAFLVLLLPLSAYAQVLPSPDDASGILTAVAQAVGSGNYRLLAALVVIGAAYVLRNILARRVAWLATKAGGYVVSYGVSLAVVLAPVLLSGKSWSWGLVLSLLSLALTAAGGYEALREVLWPLVQKLAKALWAKIFGGAAVLLLCLSLASPAQAAEPQFGGCIRSGSVCLGPSASVTVGSFNLTTHKFSGGVIPGVGYGATFMAQTWHPVGVDLYLSFVLSQGAPNNAVPSLMFSFANYLRAGIGLSVTEQPSGPATKQPVVFFGFGSNFGYSPETPTK